jgi:hypothetical protein
VGVILVRGGDRVEGAAQVGERPGSYSMVVTAPVEPVSDTTAMPSCTPDSATSRVTSPVTS